MTRTVIKGQHVIFVDEDRVEHAALVTQVWGTGTWDDEKPLVPNGDQANWPTCLNMVYVLKDDKRTDQYGNQIRHVSSVVHQSLSQAAGGYMWHHA